MKLSKVILILMVILMLACNSAYESKLKNQIVKLEPLLTTLNGNAIGRIDESTFESNINDVNRLKELRYSFELCSVVKHSFGISFQFKCEGTLERVPNYGDREYYLIKLFDASFKEQLQGFEYWADCSARIEELNNSWFYLRRHLRCD